MPSEECRWYSERIDSALELGAAGNDPGGVFLEGTIEIIDSEIERLQNAVRFHDQRFAHLTPGGGLGQLSALASSDTHDQRPRLQREIDELEGIAARGRAALRPGGAPSE